MAIGKHVNMKLFAITFLIFVSGLCQAQIDLQTQGTISLKPTPIPTGGTAIATGGTGTTWTYEAAEISGTGITIASSPFTASGPATLTNAAYITLTQPCANPGDSIQFYRTVAAGTPNSTGKVGNPATCSHGPATLTDNGLSGDGSTPSTTNTTGQFNSGNISNIRYANAWCTTPESFDVSCIENAVNSIGGQSGTVILTPGTTYEITTNYSVPGNIHLIIHNGATISTSSGITFTILGPFAAGNYQVFNGAGLISFNENNYVHEAPLYWFGGVPDGTTDNNIPWTAALATACASTSSTTQFLITLGRGDYADSQPVWVNCSNVGIHGAGRYATNLSELNTSLVYFPAIRVAQPFEPAYSINTEMFVPSLVPGPGNAVQFSSTNQGPAIRLDPDPDTDYLNGLTAFTVEFFADIKSTTNGTQFISMWGSDYATTIGHRAIQIYMNANQALCANYTTTAGGNGFCSPNNAITVNAVHHIAMSYDGTTVRLFVDGNIVGTQATSGTLVRDREEGLTLANGGCADIAMNTCQTFYDGVLDMDSIRISNIARYTAPFTPPTSKFTWDNNDIILLNFDQTNSDGSAFYAQTEYGNGGRAWIPFINVGAGGTQYINLSGLGTIGGNFGLLIWNNDHSTYNDIATTGAYVGIDADFYIFFEHFENIRCTGSKRASVTLSGGGGDNYLSNWNIEGGDYEVSLSNSDYHANHIWIIDGTNYGCYFQCSSTEEALQLNGDGSFDATGLVIDDENLKNSDHLITQIANYSTPTALLGGWIGTGNAVAGSIPIITRLDNTSMTFIGTAFYGPFTGQPEVMKITSCNPTCSTIIQNPSTNYNYEPTAWSNMPSVTDIIYGPQHSLIVNQCSGTATLANGTVTINNPCILGTRPISLSENTAGTPNALGYTQSSGSLTVNSASASDNSPISWTQN